MYDHRSEISHCSSMVSTLYLTTEVFFFSWTLMVSTPYLTTEEHYDWIHSVSTQCLMKSGFFLDSGSVHTIPELPCLLSSMWVGL